MARKKSAETIDGEIVKVMADMSKLQDRYDISLLRNTRIFRNRLDFSLYNCRVKAGILLFIPHNH